MTESLVHRKVEKYIKSSVTNKDLTKLVFGTKDLRKIHWVKQGKEFEYRNKLFDVVRKIQAKDGTVFYCLHDYEEQAIKHKIAKLINDSNNTSRHSPKKMVKKSLSSYFDFQSSIQFESKVNGLFIPASHYFKEDFCLLYFHAFVEPKPPQSILIHV